MRSVSLEPFLFRPRDRGTRDPSRRIPIVALGLSDQNHGVLIGVSLPDLLDVHRVKSCEDAMILTRRLDAPVILLDRDWFGTDWRVAVKNLASLPQRPCVILLSGTSDQQLWRELARCGGYDTLLKPLQKEHVARMIRLALAYWRVTSAAGAQATNIRS
jgi:FixJ family two-component response regulator